MKIHIIDGSLQDFINDDEDGYIDIKEDDMADAISIARMFLGYGKTVVIEPESDGE